MPGRHALQPGALHRVNNGGMAEWSMAAVLKTVVRQRTGGSNPSSSASLRKRHWRAPMPFCLLGALPLMYPAAPGLRPSDRPPPFALVRSLTIFAVQTGTGGSPEGSVKPDGIPMTPVEKNLENLYRSGFFRPTCRDNRGKPLQVMLQRPQATASSAPARARTSRFSESGRMWLYLL